MSLVAMRNGTLVALLAAGSAAAETFYRQDGVVFEGTIRQAVSEAAVCNVLEEKYTEQEYEKLKANHGRPLDLWQVDFTVRNESSREIEYLRASSWVRSEHPPCTNWSGAGPGGGPVLPEPSLLIPIVWTDYYEVLQKPSGMRRDQQERRALYLLVFDGQRPQFGEWDIDYRFAYGATAGAVRGGGSSGRESVPAAAEVQLPPEIQSDLYLLEAEQAVRDGDRTAAREALVLALQGEHGLEPAPEDHYRYAEAWEAIGEPQRARKAAVRYLRLRGREAEHYTEALELMSRLRAGTAEADRVAPGPEPTCTGQTKGTSCWMELESHPGCHVWNTNLQAGETVTWSAGCADGLASGSGTLKWVSEDGGSEDTGLLRAGKQHGQWVIRLPEGPVGKGQYVDGKEYGQWVIRYTGGDTKTLTWVNGKYQLQ